MAIGCRWAACSRRTALAETSRMQCFPWGRQGRRRGPAGGGKGQTEVPGQDTVHGKAGDRRLAKREVTESQGEKGYGHSERQRERGKEQTEPGKGQHRRTGLERWRWRRVRDRQGGDPEEEAEQGNRAEGGREMEGGTGQMGQESNGKEERK